ncbi:hypothetical protein [Leptolyngbya sp. FACHB-261]|uniref:hypothetical protein n=1 Tax=Leptolyngbya sp. FACHB-261 TaxID=2692806 RepID=UPI001685BE50|nr:hypothetical protein [Leptolyngbya sp. FACHB-261]MBD2103808.1 hypothetical protein [Leptolyngbya sp. FACHB-261]
MPGGHASKKGFSVKPNTNANGQIDTAADLNVNPQDLLGEETESTRTDEAPENFEATQRPSKESKGDKQD